jgi:predicted ATP-dependent serine protease
MIEIDHTTRNNSDQPALEPAKPILANQLLELEKKQRKRFTENGRNERISTGCSEIDEVIGGGFERGTMVGMSAEGGEGRLVCGFLTLSCRSMCVTARWR